MIIKNGRVCLRDEFRDGLDVRVENGTIVEIGTQLFDGSDALDASGRIVAPGYCDIHIHGYGGADMMHAGDSVRDMAEGLVRHGCTSFLPTTVCGSVAVTNEALMCVKSYMKQPSEKAATVLGAHMEGPFIESAKKGAQDPRGIFAPSYEIYEQMTAGCDEIVRMITIAPELPGAEALVKALPARVVKSIGHTLATAAQTAAAADWGFTQVTHLFNAMPAFNHREPGVPGHALADPRLKVQLISDLVHLHRDTLRVSVMSKTFENSILITDAIAATNVGDGNYKLGGLDIIVRNGEARLPEGNLAGSTLTIDRAVRNMIASVGIPEHDALAMATRIPAASIGETSRGVIAPGMVADLLLLTPDYNVVKTFVGGREVWHA